MGYYGHFSFDVTIPGEHVEAAERALREAELADDNVGLDNILNGLFHESEAYFSEERAALTQLAHAANGSPAHPDLFWEGNSYQKWRSYIEAVMSTIAPYSKTGSVVHVTGEGGEEGRWVFARGAVKYEESAAVWPDEMSRYVANEGFVQELVKKINSGEDFSVIMLLRDYRPDLYVEAKSSLLNG